VRRAVVTVMVLATGVFASGADAHQRLAATRGVLDGPVLTAGGVAWSQADRVAQLTSLSIGFDAVLAGGGPTRTLASGRPTSIEPQVTGRIAASASLIAVARGALTGGGKGERYVSPPLITQTFAPDGSPLATLAPCGIAQPASFVLAPAGQVDVDGNIVASCDASDQKHFATDAHVLAVDGRTGQVMASFPVVAPAVAVRIAGAYLAWVESDGYALTVVVADLTQGRELLRTPASRLGAKLLDFDLDSDGTVVYTTAGARRGAIERVGWISPASPSAHTTPLPAAHLYRVKITGGVIAFSRERAGRRELGLAHTTTAGRLLVTGGRNPDNGLDFDGTRLAFADTPCRTTSIHVVGVAEPVLRLPVAQACPLKLTQRPKVSATSFATTVRCPPVPGGCIGEATLRTADASHRTLGRGPVYQTGEVRIELKRAARATLRNHHAIPATITVTFIGQTPTAARRLTLRP
jgi:hypothetical protein